MTKHSETLETLQLNAFEAIKQKDFERTLGYFKQALLLEPTAVSLHNNLSNIYVSLGNLDEALKHLYEAIRLNPQHAESYNNLGRLLYKQARIPEALPHFEKALRLDPNYWEAHYNLAHSLSSLNQLNQATAHYQEVIRLVPDHPIAHFNVGLIYVENENYLLAETHLSKAVKLDAQNIEALRQLGQVYVQLGKTDEAMHTYQQVLHLNPNLADVHHNLAILYLRQPDRTKALIHFTEALKLDPTNDTAKHMVMALGSDPTCSKSSTIAPPGYITKLFDQYAEYYDTHVKTKLKYNAPGLLRNAVGRCLENNYTVGRVLDLGCGTGLCGVYFRDLALELIGVDLSAKMIAKANALGAYEKLVHADIFEYLKKPDLEPFKLIIACDVLVYAGDLEELFKNVNRLLLPDGLFAFTTELVDGVRPHYQLQPTGRFAHSTTYIHDLVKRDQFQITHEEIIVLRKQEGKPIQGQIWILSGSDPIA